MMPYIWLGILAAFLIAEALTMYLTTIWFALGALIAGIVSFFAPLPVQIFVFVAVSAIALGFLRPLTRRYITPHKKHTNADRVLDQIGLVTEDIDNAFAAGAVSVGGKLWTARSYSGEPIPKGSEVRTLMIEGVKLIVEPVKIPVSASQDE